MPLASKPKESFHHEYIIKIWVYTLVYSVFFLFSQEYLVNFWPELQAAQDLYCSVSQALQEKESEGTEREYMEHLPLEVLEAGIKSGRYIQVGKPTNKSF